MSQMRHTTKTNTLPPLYLLSAMAIGPSEPGGWPLSSSILAARLMYSRATSACRAATGGPSLW